MANLILVRHTESEWNKLGVWTGLTDISLSEKGVEEAKLAGEKLKDLPIDLCYISSLKRARQTLDQIKKTIGKEQFQKLRRGWNTGIPKGETLQDVYNRVLPYYKTQIVPDLMAGKNVLIVAHGNSLRALVKYL